mgnify:CR=1 FL=1
MRIDVAGQGARAARYLGISTGTVLLLVSVLGGGLAGVAGWSEVAGLNHRLEAGISQELGYTAILVVALGADLHPELTPGLLEDEKAHEFYTVAGAFALADVLRDFDGGRVVQPSPRQIRLPLMSLRHRSRKIRLPILHRRPRRREIQPLRLRSQCKQRHQTPRAHQRNI